MPGTKVKARQRRLSQRIGTTGRDPFIPARMPGSPAMLSDAPRAPATAPRRRHRRWVWVAILLGALVLVGGLLALWHMAKF